MIEYHIHIHGNSEANYIIESNWLFSDKEKLFIHDEGVRKGFLINHITHDIIHDGIDSKHIVRLNCQEKRVY